MIQLFMITPITDLLDTKFLSDEAKEVVNSLKRVGLLHKFEGICNQRFGTIKILELDMLLRSVGKEMLKGER